MDPSSERTTALVPPGWMEQVALVLVESLPEVATVLDRDLVTLYVGGAGLADAGWRAEELVGRPVADVVPAAHFASVEPYYRAALGGEKQEFELSGARADRTYRVALLPIEIDGEVVGLLAASQDFTGRLKAAEEERRSQERFRLFFEQSPIGIAFNAVEGSFMRVNEALCRFVGYTEEELLARSFHDITHPDDLVADLASAEELLAGRLDSYQLEKRYIRKDGALVWAHLTRGLIRKQNGEPDSFITQIKDISERREAAAALAASEQRYRTLVETSADGILVVDLSGEPTIREANPAFCRMLGYDNAELVGLTATELLIPDDLRAFPLEVGRVLSGENVATTRRFRRRDGSETLLELSAVLIGEKLVMATARDVTARVAEEEQLRETEKLTSLGILAGGIAHDFNNLLQGVLGNLSLARADAAELELDSGAEYVEHAQAAAQRAADLTRQLLVYAGQATLSFENVNVNDVVLEMKDLLAAVVPDDVRIGYFPGRGVDDIRADVTQVRQVVMNLITNAGEACEVNSGEVAVSTGAVAATAEYLAGYSSPEPLEAGRYVYFDVHDTGTGMDEETARRMFEPFFTTKFTGRGLGLAAVFGILRAHRAGIRVATTAGRGTTVTALFPVAPAGDAPGLLTRR